MIDPETVNARSVARSFHDHYETLAPEYGWSTQEASRTSWDDLPDNQRDLMVHVVNNVLAELAGGSHGQSVSLVRPLTARLAAAGLVIDHISISATDPSNVTGVLPTGRRDFTVHYGTPGTRLMGVQSIDLGPGLKGRMLVRQQDHKPPEGHVRLKVLHHHPRTGIAATIFDNDVNLVAKAVEPKWWEIEIRPLVATGDNDPLEVAGG